MMAAVNEEIADGSVLRLIEMFLKAGILCDEARIEPEEGTPQGGPLSPLLANTYLHPLDMALEAGGYRFVRYADDFVVFARTRQQAEAALALIRQTLSTLKIVLNEDKTRIVHIDDGFDFLGFRHFRGRTGEMHRVVCRKSQAKFRDGARERSPRHAGQRPRKMKSCTVTKLQRDERLMEMIGSLNRYLRSWYAYFRYGSRCVQYDFEALTGFVRRRVRSAILGRFSRTHDHHKAVPNSLLTELGLTSLSDLHTAQSKPQLTLPMSG
jgi:RNA-directed DNA polymerase